MNAPSDAKGFDTKCSKGLMMVAAFRAERLRQRPMPRDNPRQHQPARHHPVEPTGRGMADAPPPEQASVIATMVDATSIFANLVSLAAAAERDAATADQDHGSATPLNDDRDDANRSLDVQAERTASEKEPNEELGEKELDENARLEAAAPPAAPDAMPADAMPAGAMPAGAMPADTAEPTSSMVLEEQSQPHDPSLAEIGFGPGMLIRLSQLGLHTTADLARADPSQLRVALGDISRLVNVETWIDHAKQAARPASS